MSYWVWNSDKDFTELQDQMNELFSEFVFRVQDESDMSGAWMPSVDIYEQENEITLVADLSGVERENIRIKVEGEKLILYGIRNFGKEFSKERYYRIELVYGKFWRSFILECEIDKKNINAELKDGVLTISLPKLNRAQCIGIEAS